MWHGDQRLRVHMSIEVKWWFPRKAKALSTRAAGHISLTEHVMSCNASGQDKSSCFPWGGRSDGSCGVPVWSPALSSSSSSSRCTDDRYCSNRLPSWLSPAAVTVSGDPAVTLLLRLVSSAACRSPGEWNPDSGMEISVRRGAAAGMLGFNAELWAALSRSFTDDCHSSTAWSCLINSHRSQRYQSDIISHKVYVAKKKQKNFLSLRLGMDDIPLDMINW